MKTNEMQTQCRLERGQAKQTSWIPSEFATEGRIVDLKDRRGFWSEGWRVAKVYSSMPAAVIAERERDFTSHRRATDV